MFKAAQLVGVPVLLLLALRPSFAQTMTEQLLAQSPDQVAALKSDPHVAKAMKLLEVSDSRAEILKKADGVLDAEQNDRGDGKGPGCDHHQPVELRAAGVRLCEYSQGVLEIRKIGDGLNQD